MKALFYFGLVGLSLFEVLNVYFIMPMPGSQHLDSLPFAYLVYGHRWLFRAGFGLMIAAGAFPAFRPRRWIPATIVAAASMAVIWFFNFEASADRMFRQPEKLDLKTRRESAVKEDCVVLGIENNGEAKAYPIRFLVYHHQVQDTIGGKPVIVTYCSVCRTGTVFAPLVNGRLEKFRLVGMDHFNAMFEDATTHTWWRQVTGQAVIGPLAGLALPEFPSSQLTLRKWLELHPNSLVMQPDGASAKDYDRDGKFERGESKGDLTRTDPASWKDKSWVVGVQVGPMSKAYDWNRLKAKRIINDTIGAVPIVLVLSADSSSFAAFRRPEAGWIFSVEGDLLSASGRRYDLSGRSVGARADPLQNLYAHQEFWHSWRTFHPGTLADL